jgi:hypothetical protein
VEEVADCFVVGMTPPDTEGVTRRVRVHLMAFRFSEVNGFSQQTSAESEGLGVCRDGVVNMKIQVDLLRITVGPLRRQMAWGELDPDDPAILGIEDVVEVVVGKHSAIEHASPEGALGIEIAGIEDHYPSHDFHFVMLTDRGCAT